MTAAIASTKRAFAVWWKDLERWVIPSSHFLRRALPAGWTQARIGALVRQVTTRVFTIPAFEYKMAGVKWYGAGVFHRETVRGDQMSARQVTPLISGALIYNRLFAWKASFAIVPPEFEDCYVSSEFPQFILDTSRIIPEYLYLFCTLNTTIRAVSVASTGSAAVSRNRFKEEQFLSFEIPLPPLTEQKAIVARWRKAQDKIAAARERIKKRSIAINARFFENLGLSLPERATSQKAFALLWKDLDRWSIEYLIRNTLSRGKASLDKYPVKPLSMICDGISGGTPSTKNHQYWNGDIPWVSPKDMKEYSIKNTKDHITEAAIKETGVPLIPSRAVLIVMRSGILQRIVPVAILEKEASINQDLRAFRIKDESVILPEFLALYLQMRQDELLGLVKWSTTVQSLNKEELDAFPILLPPLPVQRAIIKWVSAERAEISRERESAENLSKAINAEVEALILGAKTL